MCAYSGFCHLYYYYGGGAAVLSISVIFVQYVLFYSGFINKRSRYVYYVILYWEGGLLSFTLVLFLMICHFL